MDIENISLPKASGLETVKKEFDEFISYFRKAKNHDPEKLYLSSKYTKSIRRSLVAKKQTPEFLTYKSIRIVEL